jgi:glycerophosphoryl diester phosphodiesterase
VRCTAVSADRPLVFAHRGGGALAPENTIAAFDSAISLGVDGLELDVHLSRDGVVVVHHDDTLERTTDGSGPVAERTAAELEHVDAGYRFGGEGAFPFRGRGFGVPRLRDVLDRYRGCRLIIELKQDTADLARAVIDEVRRADMTGRVCLGSFGSRTLREARTYEPRIVTSAAREEVRWALYASWIGIAPWRPPYVAFQVPECSGSTTVVTPRFVRAAHRGGVVVQVWTVDEEADMRRLLSWGVDAIITDRPDVAVRVVRGA